MGILDSKVVVQNKQIKSPKKSDVVRSVTQLDANMLEEHELNEYLNGYDEDVIKRLAANIDKEKFHGAITVARKKDNKGVVVPDRYVILAGHQRYRALLINNVKKIPCTIYDDYKEEWERIEFLITNNCTGRSTLDDLHLARNIEAYLEYVYPQRKKIDSLIGSKDKVVSEVFGLSRAQYFRKMNILKLSEGLQDAVVKKLITSESVNYIVAKLAKDEDTDEKQQRIVELINSNISDEEPVLNFDVIKEFMARELGIGVVEEAKNNDEDEPKQVKPRTKKEKVVVSKREQLEINLDNLIDEINKISKEDFETLKSKLELISSTVATKKKYFKLM